MEEGVGSELNRIIGVGIRLDPSTNTKEPLPSTLPSFYRHVVKAFEYYPITKYYGIKVTDAMTMPVDQWYQLRKAARAMAEKEPPNEIQTLVGLIKELVDVRQGE